MFMTYFDILTYSRIHKLKKYYSPCIAISFIGRYLLEARINAVTFVRLITVGGYGSDRVVMNVIGAIVATSRFGFGRSVYSFFLDRRSLRCMMQVICCT